MAKKFVLLLVLLIFCTRLTARDKDVVRFPEHQAETKALLEKVSDAQEALKTLRVKFVQTNRFKMLNKPQVLKGTLTIEKPDTVLYKYDSPSRLYFLVKDGNLLIYDPSEKKVVIQDIRRHQSRIIRYLGVTRPFDELAESFDVKWLSKEKGLVHLELYPRKFRLKRKIAVMHFWINEKTLMLKAFEIVQKDGDSIRFEFLDWDRNPRLPKDAFKVDIPEGIKVQRHLWGLGETLKH